MRKTETNFLKYRNNSSYFQYKKFREFFFLLSTINLKNTYISVKMAIKKL